ncbi:SDR family oxidoreductase [Candidatus Magnetaquicoccus inordinatus]|uniref:SDR family oxidoreductase n=1 Tax=Candidatus Magnetaquicoccus inordinatus TaxID=2496818 RepID=UPI00102BE322|nr:NAD(P)-dependent oxidoreductase [Candidatus Magnetaquicoccus inordinatus]
MSLRILLLGHTGKMGLALQHAFAGLGTVIGYNSTTLNAADPEAVAEVVRHNQPDLLINTIAFLGIDPCEKDPLLAQQINTLFPRQLAQLAAELNAVLIHFSTDAVFPDLAEGAYTEEMCPQPINLYGASKWMGDCMVMHHAPRHYIFRLPLLFGPASKANQFMERMLSLLEQGRPQLRVAEDIISSPSYSRDLAAEVRRVYAERYPWGVYHLSNSGTGSLYELMHEVGKHLQIAEKIHPASYREFPSLGVKQTRTPLVSLKLPPLRPWQEAVAAYCQLLKGMSDD